MLHFIIGASGSGKTACIPALKLQLPRFAIYDFDDIGVPSNADKVWRQESTERWLQQFQPYTKPICLVGQMVPGEIVASPSAAELEKINIVFLDCTDLVRISRLSQRSGFHLNQHILNWAAWLRVHVQYPLWEQYVIKEASSPIMQFERWDKLKSWDTRTEISQIDTSDLSINEVAEQIAKNIQIKRPLR